MKKSQSSVLILNGGSSSIKFALYLPGTRPQKIWSGALEGTGSRQACITCSMQRETIPVPGSSREEQVSFLMDWLEKQDGFDSIAAVGHRVVHGMQHTRPEKVSPALLSALKKISAYDPDHLPEEIKLIALLVKKYPRWISIACFDTAFHTTMPEVASVMALPARFRKKGLRRYGFHGLSYAYLLEELSGIAGPAAGKGRIIMAHLGSGASMAAIKNGKSIDTSMGFTPAAGLPMSSRSGDLDPGAAWYLMQEEKLSPKQYNQLINHESGLLGLSETSANMQELLKLQHTDERAAQAVAVFCYQAKKYTGAYAAALGGLDSLVFSGGIGEHAPEIRKQICAGLEFLGIRIDGRKNRRNALVISRPDSPVTVYVIPTNEELMMARQVSQVMNRKINDYEPGTNT